MKTGYLDWEQMNHFYQKVANAKEIEEKEGKRKKVKENLKNLANITPVVSEITLNDKISPIKNSIQDIQDAISILDGRVAALEITAADRCEIPKRPRRKLTIKVSA